MRLLGAIETLGAQKLVAAARVAGVNSCSFENVEPGVDNKTDVFKRHCHPQGRLPVLELCDGSYIFTCGGIFRHLLRSCSSPSRSLFGERSPLEESQVNQWIDFSTNEIDAHSFPLFYSAVGMLPDGAALPVEESQLRMAALHETFCALEQWLEVRTFLVGERLSGADIAVGVSVEIALGLSSEFWKYKNVVRYYNTVFYAHCGFAEAQKICSRGSGFPVEKPKDAPKAQPAKKEEANKPKAAVAANDDEEDHGDAPPEPKKKHNPLDDLPPPKMVLDEWKRQYSNTKDMKAAAKWLWENFDATGYTQWFARYKYNEELKQVFMTSNLTRGWFQRMEGVRKYAFGTALILGKEGDHEIFCHWIFRGQGDELPACIKEVEDVALYNWTKVDINSEKDKALIGDILAWDGSNLPRPCLDGRTFK